MEASGVQPLGYVVPTYQAPPETVWYHFLHGNVPGHQIDFMYRPDVPQEPLTQQHFSHLARLVKYIEPRSRSAYAFAIGNLSRDDTQYEPGHGAVALILGLRIQGAKDHAGRRDPPFCHAVAAIDRQLDMAGLLESALTFYRDVLPSEESQSLGSEWYHTYVRHGQNTDVIRPILRTYIADFDNLPALPPSALGFQWTTEGVTAPNRIVIVHAEEEPFESIAACAARIAEVLVESDIRWTTITSGREADVPGGVSIRFVPEHEAGLEKAGVPVFRLEDVPHDPRDIAEQLFGASKVRVSQMSDLRMGWQQLYGNRSPGADASSARQSVPPAGMRMSSRRPPPTDAEEVVIDVAADGAERSARRDSGVVVDAAKGMDGPKVLADQREVAPERGTGKKSRNQFGLLIGIAVALAVGGALAAVFVGTKDSTEQSSHDSAPDMANSASGEKEPPTALIMVPHATNASPTTTAMDAASGLRPAATTSADVNNVPSANGAPTASSGAGKKKKPPEPGRKKTSIFVVP